MQCVHCNQEHPEDIQFCPMTGKKIILPKVCPECGKRIDPSWLYCTHCGCTFMYVEENLDQQEAQPANVPQASLTTPEFANPLCDEETISQAEETSMTSFAEVPINIKPGATDEMPIDIFIITEIKGMKKRIEWTVNLSNNQAEFICPENNARIIVARDQANTIIKFLQGGLFQIEGTIATISGISFDFGKNKSRLERWFPPKTANDLKKELRGWGIGMTIMGVLSFIFSQFLDPAWGVVLIVLGIINLLIRNRVMFIFNGLALITVGVLNILSIFSTFSSGGANSGFSSGWIILGIFQIGWGVKEIRKFRKYAPNQNEGGLERTATVNVPTEPEEIKQILQSPLFQDELVEESSPAKIEDLTPHELELAQIEKEQAQDLSSVAGKNTLRCSHCSQEHPDGLRFCPVTGKEILIPLVCSECSQPVDPNLQYCTHCGKVIIHTEEKSYQPEAQLTDVPQTPMTTPGILTPKAHSPKSPWMLIIGAISMLIIVLVVINAILNGTNHGKAVSPLIVKPLASVTDSNIVTIQIEAVSLPVEQNMFQNVWESNGPEGGRILALAIDPLTPAILYVGTDGGGIFKSTNGGSNWHLMNIGLIDTDVSSLVIDPMTPATLYAGTKGGGVFKSTNGGESWNSENTGLDDGYVYSLLMDPALPSTLYAVVYDGVFKSTNGGYYWSKLNTGLNSGLNDTKIDSLIIAPTTPTTLYAITYFGVYKSTDGGEYWSAANSGLNNAEIKSLTFDPVTPTTFYAVALVKGVFKSTNGGNNWSAFNTESVYSVKFLAIDPVTPTTLYAATTIDGLFKSTNGGGDWSEINTGLDDSHVSTLAIDPTTPTTLYAGTENGGVFKSTNGGESWSAVNLGLTATSVSQMLIDPAMPATLYSKTKSGVFKSTNGGDNWDSVNTGLPNTYIDCLVIDPATPTTLYAGTSFDGVFKSTNGGVSWSAVNAGLIFPVNGPLVIDPVTPTILYVGTSNSVFKSTNGGGNWSLVSTGLKDVFLDFMMIDPASPTTLYAGSYLDGLFKSTNGGRDWSEKNTGLDTTHVFTLAIDPESPGTLYAGTSDGVFKSTNGGDNWKAINTGLPHTNIHALVIDPTISTTLYAGTSDGVFVSTNAGVNWSKIYISLPDSNVISLTIAPETPTTLYIGTQGAGVLVLELDH